MIDSEGEQVGQAKRSVRACLACRYLAKAITDYTIRKGIPW